MIFYLSIKRIEKLRKKYFFIWETNSRGKYRTQIFSVHSRPMHVDCMLDEFQWI